MDYKLVSARHLEHYLFFLEFSGGKRLGCDLSPLLAAHLKESDLDSMKVDPDWGCLEFLDGQVDIDPRTLFRWACDHEKTDLPNFQNEGGQN